MQLPQDERNVLTTSITSDKTCCSVLYRHLSRLSETPSDSSLKLGLVCVYVCVCVL